MNIFADLPNRQAAKYGDREQLRYRDYLTQQWISMSWTTLRHTVERVAVALYDLGVEEQGRICLFTQNCPEIFITHFAAFYNRAVPVPIYAYGPGSQNYEGLMQNSDHKAIMSRLMGLK